jgi:hypothetical protein
VHPTPVEWQRATIELADARAHFSHGPYVASVRTVIHDGTRDATLTGRGAIAIAPGRALRMILVGGAGATVLDAWVTRAAWRIEVPPIHLVRRGGREDPLDLPVGFLRWRFFTAFEGTLIAAQALPGATRWLLRCEDRIIELRQGSCERGRSISAARWTRGRCERIRECGDPDGPRTGDMAAYNDERSGLEVQLLVESIGAQPPDPAAFRDPDSLAEGS